MFRSGPHAICDVTGEQDEPELLNGSLKGIWKINMQDLVVSRKCRVKATASGSQMGPRLQV